MNVSDARGAFGLLRCDRCAHDVLVHEDAGCLVRRCACAASRSAVLDALIASVRRHDARERLELDVPVRAMTRRERENRSLGQRIRELRCNLGWSQVKLAAIARIGRSTLQEIEACREIDHDRTTLTRIARALDTSVDSLVAADGTQIAESPKLALAATPPARM